MGHTQTLLVEITKIKNQYALHYELQVTNKVKYFLTYCDVAFRMKFPIFIGLHPGHNIFLKLNTAYALLWFLFSLILFETHVIEIKLKQIL